MQPQKSYEKRVQSGLQPFRQNSSSKKPLKSFVDFLKYFFIVFVVITGLAAFFHFKAERAERLAQNQVEIENYAELLKPSTPTPLPSPTAKPQPIIINRLPSKVSPPSYTPSYSDPAYSTSSGYSTGSDYSSDYNTSYSPSYGDKTVSVRGYYRKNGTYVSPYTRRAPRGR